MGIREGREEPAKIADAGGKSLEGQGKKKGAVMTSKSFRGRRGWAGKESEQSLQDVGASHIQIKIRLNFEQGG